MIGSSTETISNESSEIRLVDIMGNEILLTAEERGEVKGAFKMALENIKNAMESFALSFDEVCDKLKIKDREQYRSYIK